MQTHIHGTRREIVDRKLMNRFPQLKPSDPTKDAKDVWKLQDGSFGFSVAAQALYFHGNKPGSESKLAPYGMVWKDEKALFSAGYFDKEDEKSGPGYLHLGCPKGEGGMEKLSMFGKEAMEELGELAGGEYVRFLKEKEIKLLETQGFVKVNSDCHPWDAKAPLEDETYSHSTLVIPHLIDIDDDQLKVKDSYLHEQGRVTRYVQPRKAFYKFSGFLMDNNLHLEIHKIGRNEMQPLKKREELTGQALQMIKAHFESLDANGKRVGSTWQDYIGLTSPEIISVPSVRAFLCYMADSKGNRNPVGYFLADNLLDGNVAGLYSSIVLRDSKVALEGLRNPQGMEVTYGQGFDSIAIYCQIRIFAELMKAGFYAVKLGGSEIATLDEQKKTLGAVEDKTGWTYLANSL